MTTSAVRRRRRSSSRSSRISRQKQGVERREISDEEIVERTLYTMVNEGAKILEEGMAQRASDIDVVWVYGYGWPVYRGGPMFWADTIGLDEDRRRPEAPGRADGAASSASRSCCSTRPRRARASRAETRALNLWRVASPGLQPERRAMADRAPKRIREQHAAPPLFEVAGDLPLGHGRRWCCSRSGLGFSFADSWRAGPAEAKSVHLAQDDRRADPARDPRPAGLSAEEPAAAVSARAAAPGSVSRRSGTTALFYLLLIAMPIVGLDGRIRLCERADDASARRSSQSRSSGHQQGHRRHGGRRPRVRGLSAHRC